jgi:radical SAM superfamily enzyme YgiQ (UPF0313 family)
MVSEKLDVFWECETRVDRVDRDLLRRMRRAGCISIDFGVESGSNEILTRLRKRTDKEQARAAFAYCHELGLPTRAFFMIGTPWETPRTVEETLSFARELRPTICLFFLAVPYPGSELREEFLKAGWGVPDDYDDYRHWTGGRSPLLQRAGAEDLHPRIHFARECHRAARIAMISQVCDVRHYPEILREYFRKYSFREVSVRLSRELRRFL